MSNLPTNPSESTKRRNPHLYGDGCEPSCATQAPAEDFGHFGCTCGSEKRIRQSSRPLMNNLETEFWRITCNLFGESLVKPQAMRFKLGNGIWFKPDLVVFSPWTDDVITKPIRCYEVKGPHAFRGGFENLKVAAHQWPHICWILAWKDGRQWKEQLVLP